ncbi:hypothetical protein AURANDRAFT_64537 [Aureococcus anophagefferens]|uniref:RING-type domain-containing protein n=1 Tax=Aureococcus anophagefferens TaxID=44056 RepID=F0YAH9_AURAN|nr:hypothetical protein AURANDRAFT_64537 [Aureococcus anophagefferens]EGB07997.1 hypothetical protein AURANDRAFT_64537 [Aureococcus anophagefferens]|eukprot:XP_009037361.1 hypothetical protein AURANDRAFT_64537 [Aureococcus anophagefferens]
MPLTPHEGSPDFQGGTPADELFADGSPPAGGDGAPPPAKKHRPERHGKWTPPEEAYASLVIDHFINGKAPGCAGGESLRALLAGLLRCTPMRITKKFSRTRAMGKNKSFRKTSELTAYERFELDAARATFLKMGGRKESRKRPRSDADAARHDWLTSGWQFEDHSLHGGAPDLGLQWRRREQVAAPPAASVAPADGEDAPSQVVAPPAAPAAPADGEDADAPSPPPPPVAPADGEDAPSPPPPPAAPADGEDAPSPPRPAAPADGEDAPSPPPPPAAPVASWGAERLPGCTECSFVETLIADAELGRFDLVRVAVEDAEGGCYRGVLPMAGTFTDGRALPVKSARTPIKTLRAALLPGWYVLYGKHPAALRGVDPEDEADVGGLAACKWTSASGNQARDVKILGVEKRYFEAAASHLVRGGFRARGAVFARVEAEAARLWCGGGPIVMILVDLGDGATALDCGHRIHASCLEEYSKNAWADGTAATRTRRGTRLTCPCCRAPSLVADPVFRVGDEVEAKWGGSWCPGVVDEVLSEGGYEVLWDDTGQCNPIPARDVRARA